MIIKIKEIEIQFKWWQTGLIIIGIIGITILVLKIPSDEARKTVEKVIQEAYQK
jgi:hypothetical protein